MGKLKHYVIWDKKRVKKPRYKMGDMVYIKYYSNNKKYKITKDQFREFNNEWHYKVDGKWRSEKSLTKRKRK